MFDFVFSWVASSFYCFAKLEAVRGDRGLELIGRSLASEPTLFTGREISARVPLMSGVRDNVPPCC
jgi:hypothetical protein